VIIINSLDRSDPGSSDYLLLFVRPARLRVEGRFIEIPPAILLVELALQSDNLSFGFSKEVIEP
jgi:hypothetical protein